MRLLAPGHHTLSRRTLIQRGVTSVAALATLGIAASPLGNALASQIDSTPPAPPVPAATTDPIADLAATLNYDQDTIFAFVRDEIAYESYAGVLRGPIGTLSARAGNAADQAILLGSLLTASQIPYRFATGALTPAQEVALADTLVRTSENADDAYTRATESALMLGLGVSDPADLPTSIDSDTQALVDQFQASSASVLDLARTSRDVSTSIIMDTLAGAGVKLPPLPAPALPGPETLQHAWVQVTHGPGWSDLDPTVPVIEGKPRLAAGTMDAVPNDWLHQVRISIEAENLFGTTLKRTTIVTQASASWLLATAPVALGMSPADSLTGAGVKIGQLVAGQLAIYPWLYFAGGGEIATQPLFFTTDVESASGQLGANTGGYPDGETMAVWMVVEITSPDAPVERIERALLDRLSPGDRVPGAFDPARVAPLQVVPSDIGGDTLAQLNAINLIFTSVARTPPEHAIVRAASDRIFGPVATLSAAMAGLRDTLGTGSELEKGHWSYPSAPNLTVFQLSSDNAGQIRIESDLIHCHRTVLPLADVEPDAATHPHVLAGVLDAIAEQALLAPGLPGENPVSTGPTIGAIFAAAAETGVPIRFLASNDDLAGFDGDPGTLRHLTTALDTGMYVIVPESPVMVDGVPAIGWWIVDPATGRTRDQLSDGTAGASIGTQGLPRPALNAPISEYAKLMASIENYLVKNAICVMGGVIATFMLRAMVILALVGGKHAMAGVAFTGSLGGFGFGAAAAICPI